MSLSCHMLGLFNGQILPINCICCTVAQLTHRGRVMHPHSLYFEPKNATIKQAWLMLIRELFNLPSSATNSSLYLKICRSLVTHFILSSLESPIVQLIVIIIFHYILLFRQYELKFVEAGIFERGLSVWVEISDGWGRHPKTIVVRRDGVMWCRNMCSRLCGFQ